MNAENRNKANVQTWTADWRSILVTDGSSTTNPQLLTKLCACYLQSNYSQEPKGRKFKSKGELIKNMFSSVFHSLNYIRDLLF